MSIRTKGRNKYLVDYYVIDSVTGNRLHKCKTINGNLRDAKIFEASIPRQDAVGKYNKTLLDMFKECISRKDANEYSKETYLSRFEKYVTFKNKDITKITKADLMQFESTMRNSNLANGTINSIFTYIKSTYQYANDVYDVPNISTHLKKLKTSREEKEVLTPSEFEQVISYERNPIYKAFFFTAYWTGCRRGELKALYKTDLVGDTLLIQRSMRLDESSLVDHLKNGDKLRTIKLDEDTLNVLIPLSQRKGKYMFGDETNLTNRSLERHWNHCMKESKISKHITIHNLRHSHGSILLDSGLDLATVSKRLGHSSIIVTANIYSHELDKTGQKSVDAINKIKGKTLR